MGSLSSDGRSSPGCARRDGVHDNRTLNVSLRAAGGPEGRTTRRHWCRYHLRAHGPCYEEYTAVHLPECITYEFAHRIAYCITYRIAYGFAYRIAYRIACRIAYGFAVPLGGGWVKDVSSSSRGALAPLVALIHRSAWKGFSPKFAETAFQ